MAYVIKKFDLLPVMSIDKLLDSEKSTQSMADYLQAACTELERRAIDEVLTRLLKRKPTIEDQKLCTLVYQPNGYDWYRIYYNSVLLGRITKVYHTNPENFGTEFKVVFQPE